jgi:hypothetical protein
MDFISKIWKKALEEEPERVKNGVVVGNSLDLFLSYVGENFTSFSYAEIIKIIRYFDELSKYPNLRDQVKNVWWKNDLISFKEILRSGDEKAKNEFTKNYKENLDKF